MKNNTKLNRNFPQPKPIRNARFLNLGNNNFAIVDKEDYDYVKDFAWHINIKKYNDKSYPKITNGKDVVLKKYIYKLHNLYRFREIVLHVNGNFLDCRKSNLIVSNRQTVSQLKAKCARIVNPSPNPSKYKGVSWRADIKKWQVHLKINDKSVNLGHFPADQEIDAALCYDYNAIFHYGEKAKTNKMLGLL